MARPRQPVNVVLLNGKKHLTKEEIQERRATEVKAKADDVSPPKYLTKGQKEKFEKYAKELLRIELMSNLDTEALARYIIAQEAYVKASTALRLTPVVIDIGDRKVPNPDYEGTLKNQDKLFKQARMAASDLGLTISSRCRLVVPKKQDDKPKSQEEEMFGDAL